MRRRQRREQGRVGGSGGGGGDAPAAAGTDGGADGPLSDAGLCTNSVPLGEAPLVTEVATRGALLASPAGGTIVGGTYYLVSETFYEQPLSAYTPGDPTRRTVLVTADSTGSGRMEIAASSGGEETHWAFSYSTSGTSLSTTLLCDLSGVEIPRVDGGSRVSGFTATSTQIIFFNDSYYGTGVDVLTKQ